MHMKSTRNDATIASNHLTGAQNSSGAMLQFMEGQYTAGLRYGFEAVVGSCALHQMIISTRQKEAWKNQSKHIIILQHDL